MKVVALALLAGCSWVYNAQYDARADQLEKSRQLFLDGNKRVQFITASDSRLYWADVVMPQGFQLLHSYQPSTGASPIDYAFSQASSIRATDYHVSDALVVKCSFSATVAFDATQPNAMIDMTDRGSDTCAVAGSTVYFDVNNTLTKWTPRQGAPVPISDLTTIVGMNGVVGIGVVGTLVVLEVGGSLGDALWTIDLTTGAQKWLMNPSAFNGDVAIDDRGVAYVADDGVRFATYDQTSVLVEKGIDDGGYDLNFEHSDVQRLDPDNHEYVLSQHHLVYRAKSGIFAYGFDTTKVVDLLLDRTAGDFGSKPLYRTPVVAGTTLFVQDLGDNGGNTDQPVYSVDLTGRLR